MVFVAEDPDRAWAEIGHHLLHEATTYADWQTPDIKSSVHSHARTVEDLRAEGLYEILSTRQCRDRAKERGPDALVILHPLCGGMPVEWAWKCLQLYASAVKDL